MLSPFHGVTGDAGIEVGRPESLDCQRAYELRPFSDILMHRHWSLGLASSPLTPPRVKHRDQEASGPEFKIQRQGYRIVRRRGASDGKV